MPESHIKKELKLTPEEYMEDRVIYKLDLYGKLGNRHRRFYYISSLVSIICAALVPVLIQSNQQTTAIVLSLVVTIMVSVEKLFHFRQHWRNYDSIESFLRREQLLYQRHAGIYKGKTEEQAAEIFVDRIEDGIKHEREETIEMRTKEVTGNRV